MATRSTAAASPPEPDPTEDVPPDPLPDPPPADPPPPPVDASSLHPAADPTATTWSPEYRSALDNPAHPLHHLRGA